MTTKFIAALALSLLALMAARLHAQNLFLKGVENPLSGDGAPASMVVISPIYGQLVRFSMPTRFGAVFENTKDAFYIRETVPKGETVDAWSQMITVTGHRGLAGNANFAPQALADYVAGGFRKACPESFADKALGETRFGDQEAFIAVASCGKVDGHSETALIVAVKGASDGYTIQWAERAAPQDAGLVDDPKWPQRLHQLMPIRFCPIVAGEATPFPSCLHQK